MHISLKHKPIPTVSSKSIDTKATTILNSAINTAKQAKEEVVDLKGRTWLSMCDFTMNNGKTEKLLRNFQDVYTPHEALQLTSSVKCLQKQTNKKKRETREDRLHLLLVAAKRA